MNLGKKNVKEKWFKFEGDIEYCVRPFKFSEYTLGKKKGRTVMDNVKDRFLYCLTNWKAVNKDDGKTPEECNTENKEFLFDYHAKSRDFIIGKAQEMDDALEKSLKN